MKAKFNYIRSEIKKLKLIDENIQLSRVKAFERHYNKKRPQRANSDLNNWFLKFIKKYYSAEKCLEIHIKLVTLWIQ